MTDSRMADEHLEQRWVPVVDEAGRTRMEAVWITVGGHVAASAA